MSKSPAILNLDENREYKQIHEDKNRIKDVYRGDHERHLTEISPKLFKKNIFRKVINKKIGLLYQTEPTRELKEKGLKKDFEVNLQNNLTKWMKEIAKNIELYNACYVDWKNQRIFTPMQVFEKDNEFMVVVNSDAKNKFQWVYSQNTVLEFFNKKLLNTLIPSNLTRYSKEQKNENETLELADMQLEHTKMGTYYKVATVLQSTDKLFTDDHDLKIISMDPEKIEFKSRDASIDAIHFKADLAGINKAWNEAENSIYEMSGIPKVSIIGDVVARSAKELIAKWYPMIETYRNLVFSYSEIEKQVVTDIYFQLFNIAVKKENYIVKYDKDILPIEDRPIDIASFQLENNIITIKTLLKEENPTLTDSEIDILFEANKAFNKKNKPITEGAN